MTSYSNSQSFVQRTFPPIIGSLVSPSAEQICQKNNLSFVELLRPFCTLQLDYRLKDPSGNDHYIKQLQVCVQDVNERPPQPALARKLLNEAVADSDCDVTRSMPLANGSVDVPVECSWFRAWTDTFLQVQFPSEHEFTKHLLGCMLVTSTVDPPETLQGLLQNLQQMQATAPARLPKWFCPAIFKFYVLIHDVKDGDRGKALNFFNSLKTAYGTENCHFLEINSRQQHDAETIQDHWSHCVVRRSQDMDGSGASSSPRTPADYGGIGGMPASLGSQGSFTENPPCPSPGVTIDANLGDGIPQMPSPNSTPTNVEALLIHPLSPDLHVNHFSIPNDKPTNSVINADVWRGFSGKGQLGGCLSDSDVNSIRALVRNCVIHALLPHVEKQIYILNDFVSNKKGMSRSFLSATKRLFGSARPGAPGTVNSNSVVYAPDAPELQLRRLGDLYFMFSAYTLAFQAYYTAKRELGADQAWLYYAGALEMAALSAFMQQEQTKKAVEYMEEAIVTYLNSCKMPQFATRATLLGAECLKDKQMYGEAAKQLIRMTSEDSDLRSALLLEQASYCFLQAVRPRMRRKYAFNMVLAGNRFSKAGQKRHALRCYRQAFQAYDGRGWNLAEDHIHFTIGRLAGHLNLLKEGCVALSQLLISGGKQTAAQQMSYLMEYLNMHQKWEKEEEQKHLHKLPLPVLETNGVNVLVGSVEDFAVAPDNARDAVRWARMEEIAVAEAQGASMIFRPTLRLFSNSTLNTTGPVLTVNERLTVQVSLRNPLQISLPLTQLRLLWAYTSLDGKYIENEQVTTISETVVHTEVVPAILIPPLATQVVNLLMIPRCTGTVIITGIAYSLTTAVRPDETTDPPVICGRQNFVVKGPKLKPRRERPNEDHHADDLRLHVTVVPHAPNLTVKTTGGCLNTDVLCGELETMQVEIHNVGNAPVNRLHVVTNSPNFLTLPTHLQASRKVVSDGNSQALDGAHQYMVVEVLLEKSGGILRPNDRFTLPFLFCAPDVKGSTKLFVLFHYTNANDSNPRHRVSRLTRQLNVQTALQMSVIAARSAITQPDTSTDALNLCISARNLNLGHDPSSVQITLERLLLVSKEWSLHGDALSSNDMALLSQQTVFFVVKSHMRLNGVCTVSEVPLGNATCAQMCELTKTTVLERNDNSNIMLIGLLWTANVTYSNNTIRKTRGMMLLPITALNKLSSSPLPTHLPSASEAPVNLQIFGQDRTTRTRGQQKSVSVQNVSCTLIHDDTLQHSFANDRICCANVTVCLRNCSDLPATVLLNSPDVAPRPQVLRTQLYTPHAAAGFTWAGRSHAIVEVPAKSARSVTLKAAVTSPGTYDVAAHLTVALRTQSGPIAVSAPTESPVVIIDS